MVARIVGQARKSYQCELIPIPISTREGEADLQTVTEIFDVASVASSDVSVSTPEDVCRLIQRCRVVVTGSYHAAVFALAQGIPAVGLTASRYYQQKLHGLAAQFGAGMWVVDLNAPSAEEDLRRAIELASTQAESLRPGILTGQATRSDGDTSPMSELRRSPIGTLAGGSVSRMDCRRLRRV